MALLRIPKQPRHCQTGRRRSLRMVVGVLGTMACPSAWSEDHGRSILKVAGVLQPRVPYLLLTLTLTLLQPSVPYLLRAREACLWGYWGPGHQPCMARRAWYRSQRGRGDTGDHDTPAFYEMAGVRHCLIATTGRFPTAMMTLLLPTPCHIPTSSPNKNCTTRTLNTHHS